MWGQALREVRVLSAQWPVSRVRLAEPLREAMFACGLQLPV